MKSHEWRRLAIARLGAAGVESPAASADALLEHCTGIGRLEALTGGRELDAGQLARLEELLRRREAREPLQHITGTTHFHGLELKSSPAALVPRPETEVLVELALVELAAARPGAPARQPGAGLEPLSGAGLVRLPGVGPERLTVLDIGTGTGAIALALAGARPDARVIGTDVSRAALGLAGENARRLGLDVAFLHSDLLAAPTVVALARQAALIVSNPPYLPAADRAAVEPEVGFDPAEALYAGHDGLDVFRRLEVQAAELLPPGAVLLLELDSRNVHAARAGAGKRWRELEILSDLAGRERFLRLVAG